MVQRWVYQSRKNRIYYMFIFSWCCELAQNSDTVYQNKKSGSLKWCASMETKIGNRTSDLLISEAEFYFCAKASLDRYPDLWVLQCVLHRLSAKNFALLFSSSTEFTLAAHHHRKSNIQNILILLFTEAAVTNSADLMSNRCVVSSLSPPGCPSFFFPPQIMERPLRRWSVGVMWALHQRSKDDL